MEIPIAVFLREDDIMMVEISEEEARRLAPEVGLPGSGPSG